MFSLFLFFLVCVCVYVGGGGFGGTPAPIPKYGPYLGPVIHNISYSSVIN